MLAIRNEINFASTTLHPLQFSHNRPGILQEATDLEDGDLWRRKAGYKPRFSTTETWMQIRETGVKCSWGRSIWFSQATSKFAFITWIAARGRLATMDRISRWNQGVDSTCVLCKVFQETKNHLFFSVLSLLEFGRSWLKEFLAMLISGMKLLHWSLSRQGRKWSASVWVMLSKLRSICCGEKETRDAMVKALCLSRFWLSW